MKVTICIGSSCHIKGSREVVRQLQALIREHGLEGKIEQAGTFCMDNCQQGVCVTVDDEVHSVTPETAEKFFTEQILAKL